MFLNTVAAAEDCSLTNILMNRTRAEIEIKQIYMMKVVRFPFSWHNY
jgi:hypothetical protein